MGTVRWRVQEYKIGERRGFMQPMQEEGESVCWRGQPKDVKKYSQIGIVTNRILCYNKGDGIKTKPSPDLSLHMTMRYGRMV